MKINHNVLKFDESTVLNIGDYFRAYKSKYYTRVKEIAERQRNWEDGYGEYFITMVKVDIFNKEEKLLAENSIVPMDKLISGALANYIPDLYYDPTYIGSANTYEHFVEFKIWTDIKNRCFDCKDKIFPYIGGVGTTLCDRWRCFEYFLADFKHIEGYNDIKNNLYYNHYIVDLYDIQKHIHPSNRVYAPGYVKLKPFKESDICKYYNSPTGSNLYPKDIETTMKYIKRKIDIKETLFKKQTGMIVNLNLDTCDYYYNQSIGYQPMVAMINPYMSYAYNAFYSDTFYNQQAMKEMCTVVKKG